MIPSSVRASLAAGAAVSVLLISSESAAAQTCSGASSFRDGPVRVAATAGFGDDVDALTALLAIGADSGPWGSASVSRLAFETPAGGDEIGPAYGATLGYAFDLGKPSNPAGVQLCPFAGYQRLDGVDIGLGGGLGFLKIRSRSLLAGVSVGAVTTASPTVALVPTAGLSYVDERAKVHAPGSSRQTVTDSYGVLDAGLGLVVNRRFMVQVGAGFPFGIDDAGSSFSLSAGMNFGR